MNVRSGRARFGVVVLLGLAFVLGNAVNSLRTGTLATAQEPLPKPPEDQSFVGSKQCASCHLTQFLAWKKTTHAKAFDILPAKYRTDASCLACHTTGYGEPTGYKDDSTAALAGTSCEACHGAGSKHGEIAKSFGNTKLTKEQELYVRSSIHLVLPGNACIKCHATKAHKKHPPYDK